MDNNIQNIINKIEEADCLFFDLDGVLIDTEPLYFRFWKEACLFFGFEMSDEQALSMRSRERQSAKQFFLEISDGRLDYDIVREKRIELMNAYLSEHPIKIKDHAIEYLTFLREKGKKIYIVTANAFKKTIGILRQTGLDKYVHGIISAKDVERGKPFPDVYLKACESINKKPNEVVVFEDSPNGLMSAYSAGCFTVMVVDMSEYDESIYYINGFIHSFKEIM